MLFMTYWLKCLNINIGILLFIVIIQQLAAAAATAAEYNIIFLLKAILIYNDTIYGENNPYKLSFINRNSVILLLTIKRLINKTNYTVKIVDSYPILSDNLKDLSNSYQV